MFAHWLRVFLTVVSVASLIPATGWGQDQPSAGQLLQRANMAAASADSAAAERWATAALEKDPTLAEAYYLRGRERFRLNKIEPSVADFDRYIQLNPQAESRQWERGIALYYAQRYADGAAQFKLYQTYHDNDVENSVWRFLCMAKTDGVDKAREQLLPIEQDPRVPMMQIYDLYRGRCTPPDVLKAAEQGPPDDAPRILGQTFYAHLYVGLYYEATGQHDLARRHIRTAAEERFAKGRLNRYMWDVARIHAERLPQEAPNKPDR